MMTSNEIVHAILALPKDQRRSLIDWLGDEICKECGAYQNFNEQNLITYEEPCDVCED